MKQTQNTYIGSAEIRFDNTSRRDILVNAAKKAGFLVDCSEAMDVPFNGKRDTTPYWYIVVEAPGYLSVMERREARLKLAAAWKGL